MERIDFLALNHPVFDMLYKDGNRTLPPNVYYLTVFDIHFLGQPLWYYVSELVGWLKENSEVEILILDSDGHGWGEEDFATVAAIGETSHLGIEIQAQAYPSDIEKACGWIEGTHDDEEDEEDEKEEEWETESEDDDDGSQDVKDADDEDGGRGTAASQEQTAMTSKRDETSAFLDFCSQSYFSCFAFVARAQHPPRTRRRCLHTAFALLSPVEVAQPPLPSLSLLHFTSPK
jgi:hypothetical protein